MIIYYVFNSLLFLLPHIQHYVKLKHFKLLKLIRQEIVCESVDQPNNPFSFFFSP